MCIHLLVNKHSSTLVQPTGPSYCESVHIPSRYRPTDRCSTHWNWQEKQREFTEDLANRSVSDLWQRISVSFPIDSSKILSEYVIEISSIFPQILMMNWFCLITIPFVVVIMIVSIMVIFHMIHLYGLDWSASASTITTMRRTDEGDVLSTVYS